MKATINTESPYKCDELLLLCYVSCLIIVVPFPLQKSCNMYWFYSEMSVPAWVRTQPYSEYEYKLPFCRSLLFCFPTPPCSMAAKSCHYYLLLYIYKFLSLFISIFYVFKNSYLPPRSQLRWPHISVVIEASVQNVSGLLFELHC